MTGAYQTLTFPAGADLPTLRARIATITRLYTITPSDGSYTITFPTVVDAATVQTIIDNCPTTAQVAAAQKAVPATARDHSAISAELVTQQLAAVPVTRGELPTLLDTFLVQAAAAIPFFEEYAKAPSMTARQWLEFQSLPWNATAAQTDNWTADGTATSWPLTTTLDQTQPFTLDVAAAAATVAIATTAVGATSQYVLVQQTDGSWLLECGTDPAPVAGTSISLAYAQVYPASKDRLLYDAVRSLAALMRYLTGSLATA